MSSYPAVLYVSPWLANIKAVDDASEQYSECLFINVYLLQIHSWKNRLRNGLR